MSFYFYVSNSLNDDISTINIYVGEEDGKLHFIDSAGADTVLNFNKNNFKRYYDSSIIFPSGEAIIEVGFRPKFLLFAVSNSNAVFWYDEIINKFIYTGGINNGVELGSWVPDNKLGCLTEITDTGFKYKVYSGYVGYKGFVLVFG